MGAAAGILASTMLVAPVPEAAAARSVELQWEGTAACPDATLAQERLAGYLSQSAGTSSEAVRAQVVIGEVEAGLEATLQLTTAWGESRRTLHAERCEDIADAVALVVATTIDPLLGIRDPHDASPAPRAPEVEPEPEPEPELEPLPPITPPPERDVRTPPALAREATPRAEPKPQPQPQPRRIIVVGSIAAGVGAGLRLRTGAVLEGAIGVGWRALRVLAIGSYSFAATRAVPGTDGGSIVLRAWSAGALGCGVPRFGRFELPTCAGVEGGTMLGTGDGLPVNDSAARPWLGIAARTGLHLRITPRVALALDLHGIGVVLRPTFHVAEGRAVEPVEPVYTAPPVAGRALLGVEVRWP